MKRLFTVLALLFLICSFAAVLLAFQQADEPITSTARPGALSLEEEVKALRYELTMIEARRGDEQRRLIPRGTIVAYLGKDIPDGWLLCDGKTSLDKYPDLQSVIGGDKVPDLRGYFLRGFDPEGNVDKDGKAKGRVLGEPQPDDFAKHSHKGKTEKDGEHHHVTQWADPRTAESRARQPASMDQFKNGGRNIEGGNPTENAGIHRHDIPEDGGSETRPKNIAVNYIIKY